MSRIGIGRFRNPALLLVGMVAVFVADVSTPLGIAVWLLYLPFVLAALYVDSPRAPWVIAACATLLIAISFVVKPPGVPSSITLVNRAIAAVATWASAALVHRVRPHATVEFDEFARVDETGRPLDKEARYKADGLDGWFRTSAVKSEDGAAVQLYRLVINEAPDTRVSG